MKRGERKARWIVGGVLLVVLGMVGWSIFTQATKPQTRLYIGDAVLSAQILQTDAERQKGLSGRRSLPENDAMLFLYDKADYYGIWMKDMHIDIDIVWLDEDKRVVHIVKNASPDTYPKVFRPEEPAKYIIEMNAGLVDKRNITIGKKAKFEITSKETVNE